MSETCATGEGIVNHLHRMGDYNVGKGFAVGEKPTTKFLYGIGKSDAGKACAVGEGTIVYCLDLVGNFNFGNTKYILVKPICVCEPIKWGKAN